MAANNPDSEVQLQKSFQTWMQISALEALYKVDPQLAGQLLRPENDAASAAELEKLIDERLRALHQQTKSAAKSAPAGKPSSAKRGGWDTKDTNEKVAAILRQR